MNGSTSPLHEIAQYRFLIELDNRLRPLLDAAEITLTAATLLGQRLGVHRCAYADVEADQDTFNLTGDYNNGVPSIVGRYRFADFGETCLQLMRTGLAYVVEDSEKDPRAAAAIAAYRATQIRSVLCVPLLKAGRLVAAMAVHQNTPRVWQNEEIELLVMVANRCWESIERNRIARELQQSEARFRTITNALPQIIWTATADGAVDYYNDQWKAFTGLGDGDAAGWGWQTVVHPDDASSIDQAWKQSLQTGEPYETRCRLLHRSGMYRWTLARALPIRNADGKVVRWMGSSTDIHEQKLAEEALLDANQRKDEFLAMLAHELRNPLAPISASAELLGMIPTADARITKAAAVIGRQVQHVTNLVDELLDVSRVTRGVAVLETADIDLKQAISDAVEQIRPMVRERGHHLSVSMVAEPVAVAGDHKRLVQVITNLLHNAVKFTPQGGKIGLDLRTEAAEAVITVTDDGIGMEADLVEQAFDLFRQGKRSADRSPGGLGIGLALVKSLVERHGGTIAAHSAGLGQGSAFLLRLPRIDVQPPRAAAQGQGPLVSPGNGLRVLVVDDNADAASTMAAYLEALGHHVMVAHEARDAIVWFESTDFDACLLDIGLPGMDGNALARRFCATNVAKRPVLIAVTGYGQDADRQATHAAGFDHHFVKPVDMRELGECLARLGKARHA